MKYIPPVSRAPADGAGSTFSLSKLGLGKSGAVENFLTGATETAGPSNFLKKFSGSGLFVVDSDSLDPQIHGRWSGS